MLLGVGKKRGKPPGEPASYLARAVGNDHFCDWKGLPKDCFLHITGDFLVSQRWRLPRVINHNPWAHSPSRSARSGSGPLRAPGSAGTWRPPAPAPPRGASASLVLGGTSEMEICGSKTPVKWKSLGSGNMGTKTCELPLLLKNSSHTQMGPFGFPCANHRKVAATLQKKTHPQTAGCP